MLDNDNVVYNQALRLISDVSNGRTGSPDCIVVFAGANDAWFSARRPGIFDEDKSHLDKKYSIDSQVSSATSLLSSVALVCDILQQSFPSAYFIIVTPIQMSKVSADNIFKVSDTIEKAAVSRGCSVLRADKYVDIRHEVESKKLKYTYDGVHTNPEGARLIAKYILPCLNMMTTGNDGQRTMQN